MAFDGLLLSRIVQDLQSLKGAKIGKIQNVTEEEILISVHGKECKNARLAINVHPNTCRMYLSAQPKEFLAVPSAFVMVLRKHISQGTILSIEQEGLDRLVKIQIRGYNEFADPVLYTLYAELMGKYANLILCSEDGTILDCLKRIPVFENSKHLIHPGAKYEIPERPDRKNPLDPEIEIDPDTSIVKQAEGFSPQLSKEFLYRMQNGQKFPDIVQELMHSDRLYVSGKDFHCLPIRNKQDSMESFPLMEGLENLYASDEKQERIKQQAGDVQKAVQRELKKIHKKMPKLEEALEESLAYEQYREYGDLLFAYPEAEKSNPMTLPSLIDDTPVTFEIDPRYSLKDNANLFYKKYHKHKRGVSMLQEQIEQNQNLEEYYEQILEQLKFCSVQDALEIKSELIERRIMREKKDRTRKKKNGLPNVLHLRYLDTDFYAGKNNLQNQYITFKLGKRSETWFHVKDYHGSHVLIQNDRPTEEQIRFAACLAACFSKGRHSSSVPVDYTTISQLKKIPGKAPGFVSMKNYRTIYVDPDWNEMEDIIKKHKVK